MFYETKKLRDKNMYIITHVGSDKHRHPIFKEEYSWLDSQLINFFLYNTNTNLYKYTNKMQIHELGFVYLYRFVFVLIKN